MYSYHDRVSYSRIDKDGLLGVSDTVNAMQDCCLFHSEDVGHSALDLLKKNRAWISERMARCIQTPSGYGRAFSRCIHGRISLKAFSDVVIF